MFVQKNNLPVMILAGGLGTRLREETEFRPKPMVPIGTRPILWHIMKLYSHYGFYRFIICLGYKGHMIKNYFLQYKLDGIDFTINTRSGNIIEHQIHNEDWQVTLVDTGFDCYTGGRIARAARYVDTDRFLLTYGDGVSDVNIEKLLAFHMSHGKCATLTGVNLPSRFGNLALQQDQVISFLEKKRIGDEWINGGFFVLEKSFLQYVSSDASCIFEKGPLAQAAQDGQLMMYRHNGFWQCMDTLRERMFLEELWKENPPWKVWKDNRSTFIPARKIRNLHIVGDKNEKEILLER
jgi:glucose-1-phosphate cytidylyltransferase